MYKKIITFIIIMLFINVNHIAIALVEENSEIAEGLIEEISGDIEEINEEVFFNGIRTELEPILLDSPLIVLPQLDRNFNDEFCGSVTKFEKTPYNDKKPLYEVNGKYLKNVDFGIGFRGNLNYDYTKDKLNTFYDVPATDIITKWNFQDNKTSFNCIINPILETTDNNALSTVVSNFNITHKLNKNQMLKIGRDRVPIGFEGKLSNFNTFFIDKSQIAQAFSNIRSEGISNQGNYKYIDYNVGVFNSSRTFGSFEGLEVASWLGVKPLENFNGKYGNLVVGAGLNLGEKDASYSVCSGYLGYTYKKFIANFEYSNANRANGQEFINNNAYGLYTTLGCNLTPKVQLLTRYDFFDPDKSLNRDTISQYSTGINYYLKQQKMKIGINYVYVDKENQSDASRILFVTQFAF